MSFRARTPEGDWVNVTEFKSKFEVQDRHPVLFSPYPDCDSKVAVVTGYGNVRMHFRHPRSVVTQYEYHAESPRHLLGKENVAKHLKGKYKGDKVSIEFEVPVKLGEQKRIIDVAVIRNGSVVEAHEIQISPQTVQQLDARSDCYTELGIEVFWYFGSEAGIVGVPWANDRFGGSARLLFGESCENITDIAA